MNLFRKGNRSQRNIQHLNISEALITKSKTTSEMRVASQLLRCYAVTNGWRSRVRSAAMLCCHKCLKESRHKCYNVVLSQMPGDELQKDPSFPSFPFSLNKLMMSASISWLKLVLKQLNPMIINEIEVEILNVLIKKLFDIHITSLLVWKYATEFSMSLGSMI